MFPLKREKKIAFKTCSEIMRSVCLKLTNSRRFRVKSANSSNNWLLLQNIKHPNGSPGQLTQRQPAGDQNISMHPRLSRAGGDSRGQRHRWDSTGGRDGTSCDRDTHRAGEHTQGHGQGSWSSWKKGGKGRIWEEKGDFEQGSEMRKPLPKTAGS